MMELTTIKNSIHEIREKKVILDFELAKMYEVEMRVLKQAVRRNIDRFPEDFMFELTEEEMKNLTSQIVMSSWGGTRYCKKIRLKSNQRHEKRWGIKNELKKIETPLLFNTQYSHQQRSLFED